LAVLLLLLFASSRLLNSGKGDGKKKKRRLKTAVVVGASRGLGADLSRSLLALGVEKLVTVARTGDVDVCCDVTTKEGQETVIKKAQEETGGLVDVFVVCAARTCRKPARELTFNEIGETLTTNLVAPFQLAVRVFQTFPEAHVFFVDGAGSRGNATPRSSPYGASKAALPQLVKSLSSEGHRAHCISPGMFTSSLLLDGHEAKHRRVFNILCETPKTVGEWVARNVKEEVERDSRGTYRKFLTPLSVLWRFVKSAVVSPKNRLVDEQTGKVVYC